MALRRSTPPARGAARALPGAGIFRAAQRGALPGGRQGVAVDAYGAVQCDIQIEEYDGWGGAMMEGMVARWTMTAGCGEILGRDMRRYFLTARVLRAGGIMTKRLMGEGKGYARDDGVRTDHETVVEEEIAVRRRWLFDYRESRNDGAGRLPVVTRIWRGKETGESILDWDCLLRGLPAPGDYVPQETQLVAVGRAYRVPAELSAAREKAQKVVLDVELKRYHEGKDKRRDRDHDKGRVAHSGGRSLAAELAALGALRQQGVLSEDEFVAAKKAEIARRQG